MQSNPKLRIVSILLYAGALASLQFYVVRTGLLPNENSVWLLSGFAGLLFWKPPLKPLLHAAG